MAGFIISVESNNRVWYLIGTIVMLAVGIGLTIGGFASGTTFLGVFGIVFAVAAAVLLIDAIANLASN